MKKMSSITTIIWIFLFSSGIVQGFLLPLSNFARVGNIFPWPILIFVPVIIIIGSLFYKGEKETLFIRKNIDQRFGDGSYINFMKLLKPELLLSSMCFGMGLVGALRVVQTGAPSTYLSVCGFFISSGFAFMGAHLIRGRCVYRTTSIESFDGKNKINSINFWKLVKRRRNIFFIAIIGGFFSVPILMDFFAIIFSTASWEMRGWAVLIMWVLACVITLKNVINLCCYSCKERAFSHPFFFMKDAKCRHCGVGYGTDKLIGVRG